MQDHWKSYFLFSIKEQKGIIVLGLVLLLSIIISVLLPKPILKVKQNKAPKQYVLFNFDPNSIDSVHALLLGIPARQISTLLHYRNKGGRFYQKEDLAHWYGLKKDLLEKLIPYVNISSNGAGEDAKRNNNNRFSKYNFYGKSNRYLFNDKSRFATMDWVIDINEATEAEWVVQTKLSKMVIENLLQYKQHLGGFHSIYEISKVYGMTDSIFQIVRPHLMVKNKIDNKWVANLMTFDQWKMLGLFQDKEIKQLLHYKKEHGGKIGWRELVIEFDLTESQADWLKTRITIQ